MGTCCSVYYNITTEKFNEICKKTLREKKEINDLIKSKTKIRIQSNDHIYIKITSLLSWDVGTADRMTKDHYDKLKKDMRHLAGKIKENLTESANMITYVDVADVLTNTLEYPCLALNSLEFRKLPGKLEAVFKVHGKTDINVFKVLCDELPMAFAAVEYGF